jgi:hypothetical protein
VSARDGGPALAVFSGVCLEAVCGTPIGANDMHGEPLHTGDIVSIFTVDERITEYGPSVEHFPDGLTVVVSDEWTTYSNGTYVRKDGAPEFFIMGIKSVPLRDPGEWRVIKVKSYEDVLLGERWPAYGFNYGEVPTAVHAMLSAREAKQP